LQWEVKNKISSIKNVPAENMLLGNGSDECIDLLIRAFCEPAIDNVIICPPTYGMYEVCAHINNVAVKAASLTTNYQIDLDALQEVVDANTKIIFLCSPNNPTGNSLNHDDVELILNNFDGLVILDEAYINFSRQRSFAAELQDYPNLVILQTFSKAWGLAALRLGMLFASTEIVGVLNKIKPPYNINQATQELALQALEQLEDVNAMIRILVEERETLVQQLSQIPIVQHIYPSDANFILVKVNDAVKVYEHLKNLGIIVRNRNNVVLCEGCLRITIGTPDENKELVQQLLQYSSQLA
jgi:histidinol-phosphate aminotransferase